MKCKIIIILSTNNTTIIGKSLSTFGGLKAIRGGTIIHHVKIICSVVCCCDCGCWAICRGWTKSTFSALIHPPKERRRDNFHGLALQWTGRGRCCPCVVKLYRSWLLVRSRPWFDASNCLRLWFFARGQILCENCHESYYLLRYLSMLKILQCNQPSPPSTLEGYKKEVLSSPKKFRHFASPCKKS